MEFMFDRNPRLVLANSQLYEAFRGWPLLRMGSPASMGAARWTLRQIINYCGIIPESMLEKAQYAEQLKDQEKDGNILI
jgi:hypothetical protein